MRATVPRSARRAARVIAVSEAVAHTLRAQGGFDAGKIRVVANGVDLRRFGEARAAFERALELPAWTE
jgi:hypothetical protein